MLSSDSFCELNLLIVGQQLRNDPSTLGSEFSIEYVLQPE